MTQRFTDILTIDGATRKREGGYLVADARVARTGIQLYNGSEVGRPDLATVRVYRSPEAVFDKAAMASFANIPITNDHPSEPVTADNWAQYARGQTDGDIARDGERLRVPLMVSDAATIAQVEAGKRELSAGYTCTLDWTNGVTPGGELYDAKQENIRANHVAIVAAGRAGSDIRIGDGTNKAAAPRISWGTAPLTHVDEKAKPMTTLQTVVLGDKAISVDTAHVATLDAYKAKVLQDATDAKAASDKVVADMQAIDAKKDAEIADLKTKVLTDAQIDERVQVRAALIADAKAIAPGVDTTSLSDADIRKAVVSDKLGAAAVADKAPAYIDARFDILNEDAKAKGETDPFRKASIQHDRKALNDGETAQDVRDAAYNGYLGQLNGTAPTKGA